MLLMLGNVVPLWEIMLAAMKLGAVVIPATTLLTPEDLHDRLDAARDALVVTASGRRRKFDGSTPTADAHRRRRAPCRRLAPLRDAAGSAAETSRRTGATRADDPLLLYFTSGTTAKPKLVLHSHGPIRSGICRRCTGSACSPATCI